MRNTLGRLFRLAALAVTVSLACGSVAWGQSWAQYDDDDRYRHDEAREQGFHRGFDDGSRKVPVMVLPEMLTSWIWRCSTACTKSE